MTYQETPLQPQNQNQPINAYPVYPSSSINQNQNFPNVQNEQNWQNTQNWQNAQPATEQPVQVVQVPVGELSQIDTSRKILGDYIYSKVPVIDTRNMIYMYLGADYYNAPFLMGPSTGAEYRVLDLLAPFYFGGGIIISAAFTDDSRCGFTYKINDKMQRLPFLADFGIYVPCGFIFPLKTSDIQILVNLRVGGKLSCLCFLSSKGSAISNPSFSFFCDVAIGVMFFDFEFDAGCKYNTIGSFSPFIEIGYNLKFGKEKIRKNVK